MSENQFSQVQPKLQRDIMKISEHQLGTKFRSKHDIYIYLTEILQLYLPPESTINKDFIRQILKNEKKLLSLNEVKFIKVPRYEELTVKQLYADIMDDPKLKDYFPDINEKTKSIDRNYFFNILNSIYPEYMNQVLSSAQENRNKPELNEEKKDYILISDSWYNKLMAHPFISKKPGKTLQLLKESTKILKARKQRQRKENEISLKRFKAMKENVYRNDLKSQKYDKEESHELFDYENFDMPYQQTNQVNQQFRI